jgi:hypothetical protein
MRCSPNRPAAVVAVAGLIVSVLGATPAFAQVVGPQVRVDPNARAGAAANETTAAASELFPERIVMAWNDWRQSTASEVIRTGASVSFDGGATWNDFELRPPVSGQSGVEGDPMTAFDDRTGTLWIGAISFASNGGLYVARLNPGSTTFQPSRMVRVESGADKCWMAAGPRPGLPNTTRVYIAYNRGVLFSDDMGDTWTNPVNLGTGLGFLPRIGPAGELYVAYWNAGTQLVMRKSTDGGLTFAPAIVIANRLDTWGTQDGSRFPGNFRVPPMVYFDVNPTNGHLYAVYFDTTSISGGNRDVDLYFTRSINGGSTWSTPAIIPDTDGGNTNADQFFSWLECDRSGNIHMIWNDGRNTVQADASTNTNAFFDTYYGISRDEGATWTQRRLTPVSWNANNDGLNRTQQFIGDYLGVAQAGDRIYPCYIDTTPGDPNVFTNVITSCPGDFNHDGQVDFFDYLDFVAAFNAEDRSADFNGDAQVDFFDYLDFVQAFGIPCP